MKYKRRLLLTLLLGLLVWAVPLAAQTPPRVESVKVSVKGAEPGKAYQTATMDAWGEALPVTFVIECYPAGSWQSVTGIRLDSLGGVLFDPGFHNPRWKLPQWLKRTDLGWELTTKTVPGKEGEKGVRVKLSSEGNSEQSFGPAKVHAKDVHVDKISLTVEPQGKIIVGRGGTIKVKYEPENATDKRVKFDYDANNLTIEPTEEVGVYRFTAKGQSNMVITATAENGVSSAKATAEINTVQYGISAIKLSMQGSGEQGGMGFDNEIYRHKTKVWHIEAEITSNGPIEGNVYDMVGWTLVAKDRAYTRSGAKAAIYGNSKEGVNDRDRGGFSKVVYPQFESEQQYKVNDREYKTVISYAFKADEVINESPFFLLKLELKGRPEVNSTYRLKIGEYFVNHFRIDQSDTMLLVGSEPNGFITVTPEPEMAYDQRFDVSAGNTKKQGDQLAVDRDNPNRYNFSVGREEGDRTLTIKAKDRDGHSRNVTVKVGKLEPESIAVLNKTTGKEINPGDLLELAKGEKVDLLVSVKPEKVYDARFTLQNATGARATRLLSVNNAGELEITAQNQAWGEPGLYTVEAKVPRKTASDKGSFTLTSVANKAGQANERVEFTFNYTVKTNEVNEIKLSKPELNFTYDVDADGKIREGAQVVRINVLPETAADRTFSFKNVPGWLDILDVQGRSVKGATQKLTSGEYYFKVSNPNQVSGNKKKVVGDIKVVSTSVATVESPLTVNLNYIKVKGYTVAMTPSPLKVNEPAELTIEVEPRDASNPHFKLVVESNTATGLNKAGKWSGLISVLDASGRKVNGSASLTFTGSVVSKPGKYTVVSSKQTDDGEELSFKIQAVEQSGVNATYGEPFKVEPKGITNVSYENKLLVEIRDQYFRHDYTALEVKVKPENIVNPRVEFVNAVNRKDAPKYVDVEGPVNGYYLFTPKKVYRDRYEEHEEQLVGIPKDQNSGPVNGGNITVKVVNVRAESIEVVDMDGKDITQGSNSVVRGVTKRFPFRVKVKPWKVSLASVELKPVAGATNLVSGLRPSRIVRDSAAGCLVVDYLLNVDKDFTKASFTVGHKYLKDGTPIPTVTFEQAVPEIQKLTVEPAEVTLVGEGAKAKVKVTYLKSNAFKNAIKPYRNGLSNVSVTEVSHLDNVYTYELRVTNDVESEGKVTFKPVVGEGVTVCNVKVINPKGLQELSFTRTELVELTLGEAGKDYVEFDLVAKSKDIAVVDALFEKVEWRLKDNRMEFAKYLKVEKLGYKVATGAAEASWKVKLTGLNVTADGLNDKPLELQAWLSGKSTGVLLVKVNYGAKANEKTVERVAFPVASLELAVGETQTIDMQVTPQDVSLKQLRWDFPKVNSNTIGVCPGATWNQLQITGEKVGNTWLRVRAADRLGAYTSPLLYVKVVPGYYDLVLDAVDGESNALEGVHVVVKSDDGKTTIFDGYTTSSSKRVTVRVEGGKWYRATASRGGYKTVDERIHVANSPVQKKLVLDRNLSEPVLYGVRVKVVDGSNPIPGAEVVLAGFKPQQTDADGVAQYYQVPAGSYSVSARADGFEPSSKVINHVGDKNTEEVTISLQKSSIPSAPKHALTVTVLDDESGTPLQDARVTLEARPMQMTDIAGQVTIENLADGTYGVVVEGPANGWTAPDGKNVKFNPQTFLQDIQGADGTHEVRLQRVVGGVTPPQPATHKLTVIVCESEFGGLLNGAEVRLSGVASKVTEDGQVSFNDLVGNQVPRRVDVSKAGYVPQSQEVVVSHKDEIVRFVLAPQTYSVTLTVKGKDGAPLSGATVYLDGSKKLVTSQEGVVTFGKVRSGQHELMVAAVGYKDGKMTIEVASDFNGELQLAEGVSPVLNEHTLTIVVKEGATAVEGATVRLESGEEQVTNGDGKAQFKVLDGEYTVKVAKVGYDAVERVVLVAGGDKEETIGINASTSPEVFRVVTISVLDAVTNAALSNAEVKIVGATPKQHEGNVWVYELKQGEYSYVVSSEGYKKHVAVLRVEQQNIDETVKLTRGENAKFTVTVTVASSGSPVEGANVEIEGQTAISTEKNVTKFSLESGIYTVKVSKEGYAPAEKEFFVDGKDEAVAVELRPMLKVIFNANGGKFADGKPTQEVEVAKGDRVSPLSKNPERLGFKFTAWFLDGREYDFAEKVNQPITLDAQWEEDATSGLHTVTFIANGGKFADGKDVRTIKVKDGDKIDPSQVEVPQLNGRTFKCWFLDGTEYTFGEVKKDITLEAQWDVQKKYVVSFEVAGGTPQPQPQTVNEGKKATEPTPAPTKTGYTFDGWYLGSDKYDFSKEVTANIKLMAKWEPNAGQTTYTVTFNAEGGKPIPLVQTIVEDGNATEPVPAPTKDGFTFVEWQLDGTKYDFNMKVTKNIELKAKWEKDVTVEATFIVKDENDEAVKDALVSIDGKSKQTGSDGKAVIDGLLKQLYTYTVTHDNYAPADGTVDLTTGNQEVKVTLKEKTIVKVTFIYNDGVTAKVEKEVNAGEAVQAPAKPEWKGHTFVEWQLNGTEYDFNTKVTESITLTALWTVNKYTVTFNADGGTPEPEKKSVEYNKEVDEPTPAPKKDGFTFKGWYLPDDTKYDFSTKITEDITLKALWEEISATATVTFTVKDDAGNVVGGAQIKIDGKTKETLSDGTVAIDGLPKKADLAYEVTKVGYVSASGTIDLTAGDKQEPVTLERATYTVTFDSDGGSAVDKQNVKYNEKATKPVDPTKGGYDFVEWQLDGTKYDFGQPVNADITLKAVWKTNPGVQTYTVTFDSDGGTAVQPESVKAGEKATRPTNPTKDGYDFVEWQLNGTTYNFDDPVNADITLKAVWKANGQQPTTYTVTFDSDGGTAVQPETVKAGETATKPADPTKDGFTFKGWYLDGATESYDFSTKVSADITLKAKWDENSNGTAVESELLATVRIYPNPATVTLVVSAESVIARYELVSLNGTKVLSGISSESELRLDVSQLADGVYVLLLEDAEGGVATRRVSVRR